MGAGHEDAIAEDSKVLIFSQFVETIKYLETRIDKYEPLIYTGSMTEHRRQAAVDNFMNDPNHKVLLLSLRAGGVGLNLTAANYVVHFDSWWNPAVESQAEDRVYRIGQTKSVIVTSLVCVDTVEERIQRLLEAKRTLFRDVIDDLSDVGLQKVLTEEELFGLFNLKPPERKRDVEVLPNTGKIRPDRPYSNLVEMKRLIHSCTSYVHWLDKHFDRKALEWLAEAILTDAVSHVWILSGKANVTDEARRDFKRFREEMAKRGVTAEWRVHDLHDIHDRYLITVGECYNIPPVNTISTGGWSDIKTVVDRPPFERWWERAVSIFG